MRLALHYIFIIFQVRRFMLVISELQLLRGSASDNDDMERGRGRFMLRQTAKKKSLIAIVTAMSLHLPSPSLIAGKLNAHAARHTCR